MKSVLLRFALICLLVLTTLSFAGPAFAEDETLPDPGLTPDSPFYFFDNLTKQISMFFTLGDEAKAGKALRYAEERLAEARAMAAENRVRETERAANGYEGYMAQVRQRLEDRIVSTVLSERVAVAAARHLDLLERVREQVPREAGDALECARKASADGQLNALRALAQDRPERAIDIIECNLDRQIEKAVIRLTGDFSSANITAYADGVLDHAARLTALEEEMTDLAEARGVDLSEITERLARCTSKRLQALSGVYETAPVSARAGLENAIDNSVRKYERSLERLQECSSSGNFTDAESWLERIGAEVAEGRQVLAEIRGRWSEPGTEKPAPEPTIGSSERPTETVAARDSQTGTTPTNQARITTGDSYQSNTGG
jgi:hypothetical protein